LQTCKQVCEYLLMQPFTREILTDVTPIWDALAPVGSFGVLIRMDSGIYGLEVQPYKRQWSMDIVTEAM